MTAFPRLSQFFPGLGSPQPSSSYDRDPYGASSSGSVYNPFYNQCPPSSKIATVLTKIPKLPPINPERVLPLDHIPLSAEELEQHSQLTDQLPSSSRRPTTRGVPTPTAPTLLDFADGFLDGAGKLSTKENIDCWNWLIHNCEFSSPQKDIIVREIESLKNLHNDLEAIRSAKSAAIRRNIGVVATEFAQRVHELQPGESTLMTGTHFDSYQSTLPSGRLGLTSATTGKKFLYEFTKNEDGTYTITLCSSSQFHLSQRFSKGDKTRFTPILCYAKIPEHKLFFNNSESDASTSASSAPRIRNDFFKSLLDIELRTTLNLSEDSIFTILDSLGIPPSVPANSHCIISVEPPNNHSHTSSSGTNSLKVWIRKLSGDNLNAYRQLMFRLKFKMFVTLYHSCNDLKNNDLEGKRQRDLLERTARNLLRGVGKLTNTDQHSIGEFINRPSSSSSSSNSFAETSEPNTSVLDPHLAAQAIATAYDAIQRVQQLNKDMTIAGITKPITKATHIPVSDNAATRTNLVPAFRDKKSSKDYKKTSPLPIYSEIEPHFDSIFAYIEQIRTTRYNTVVSHKVTDKMVDYLVDHLSIPGWVKQHAITAPVTPAASSSSTPATSAESTSPVLERILEQNLMWDNLSTEQALRLANVLQSLLENYDGKYTTERYHSSWRNSHYGAVQALPITRLTRVHATVLSLHAIIHYLIVKVDRETFAETSVPRIENFRTPNTGHVGNELDLVYLDPKEFARIQKAHAYFEAFNSDVDTSQIGGAKQSTGALFDYSSSLFAGLITILEEKVTKDYFSDLIENVPGLKEEVLRRVDLKTDWNDLTDEEIELQFEQEVQAVEEWTRNNTLYQALLDYQRAENAYWTQYNAWKLNPKICIEPTKVAAPPENVLNAAHPGSKPKDPERKCNISEDKKLNAIMKELDPTLLDNHRLSHILTLAKTVYYSREHMHALHIYPYVHFRMERRSPYKRAISYAEYPIMTYEPQLEELQKLIQQFHPVGTNGRKVLNRVQSHRKVKDRQRQVAEGTTLKIETEHSFLKKLLRTASESNLTPYQLIFEAKNNLAEFSSEEMQGLFFRLFFRSSVTQKTKEDPNRSMFSLASIAALAGKGELVKNQAKLNAGQYLVEDNNLLLEQCRGLIDQGTAYYAIQPSPVTGGKFFFELAFFVSKYLKDNLNENRTNAVRDLSQIRKIEEWLEFPGLNNLDRATLHFYRVLFLSISVNELTDEDYVKVFESWIKYSANKSTQVHTTEATLLADHFIQQSLVHLKVRFVQERQFTSWFGNSVIEAIGFGQLERNDWGTYRYISLSDNQCPILSADSGDYQINLQTGAVSTPNGVFSLPIRTVDWRANSDFQALFKKKGELNDAFYDRLKTFTFTTAGAITNVRSPDHAKPFELRGNEYDCTIQRQFDESDDWYRYVTPRSLNSHIPAPLHFDHTFWALTSQARQRQKGIQGYFTSSVTQKRKFALCTDGRIIEVDATTGNPTEKSRTVESGIYSFRGFDTCALAYQNDQQITERLQFVRYASLDRNPLAFVLNKGLLVWTENEQYCLLNSQPTGYVGALKNYLYLHPLDAKLPPKVLIPFQAATTFDSLNVSSTTPMAPTSQNTQWGQYQYFTYDMDGVTLKPTSQEGQVFLAYLQLSQGNSEAAVALLSQLRGESRLSPISMKILDLIIEAYLSYTSFKPTANHSTVILHAVLHMMKEKDRRASDPVEHYFSETVHTQLRTCYGALKLYYESLNNVSVACRLSLEDELYLIQKMQKELLKPANPHPDERISSIKSMMSAGLSLANMFGMGKNLIPSEIQQALNELAVYDPAFLVRLETRAEWIEKKNARHAHQITPIGGSNRVVNTFNHSEMNTSHQSFFHIPSKDSIYKYDWNAYRGDYVKKSDAQIEHEYQTMLSSAMDNIFRSLARIDTPYETYNAPGYANTNSFLFQVLRIAKTRSLGERNSLLFWIRFWRLNHGADQLRLDLMTTMLLKPEAYPEPIDVNRLPSLEAQRDFLIAINNGYKNSVSSCSKYYGEPSSKFTSLPDYNGSAPSVVGPSVFDLKNPGALSERTSAATIEVTFDLQESRWNQLEGWKRDYLIPLEPPVIPSQQVSYQYQEGMLDEHQIEHKDALVKALEDAQIEHEAGKAKNESAITYDITDNNCYALQDDVTEQIQEIENQLKSAERALLDWVNKEPLNLTERQNERAKLGGKVKKRLTFKDCVALVLKMDSREYFLKNSSLTDPSEIAELANQTLQVCDMKSRLAQLKRIQATTIKLNNNHISSLERSHLILKLEEDLSARYHFDAFDDETQVALRVFCSQTGKIPFSYQTDLLEQMLQVKETDPDVYKDIVIQLIMGGGKTSVLATILMYLAARRKDRIALFIVPPALFTVVKSNLGASLKEAFEVDLESIDLSRDEMTSYRLDRTKELMERARDGNSPIISKGTTLQCLQLELRSQAITFKDNFRQAEAATKDLPKETEALSQRKKVLNRSFDPLAVADAKTAVAQQTAKVERLKTAATESQEKVESSSRKLHTLNEIMKLFRNNTDALVDEVDQVLNAMQEVNFPVGTKIPISPESNDLLLYMYQALVNENIMAKPEKNIPINEQIPVSVASLLEMTKKDRTIISTAVYMERVVPAIAEYLANTYEPFAPYLTRHKASFIRFASGQMPAFLESYKSMSSSDLTAEFLTSQGVEWNTHTISSLQADLRFIQYIKSLFETTNPDEKIADNERTAANMISLARGLLQLIMTATLSKSGNRDYGLLPGSTGEIVPFLAVNVAAMTKFGYHYEEGCYYYQWPSAFEPSELEITTIAKEWYEAAQRAVEIRSIPYLESAERVRFMRFFGVELEDVAKPERLKANPGIINTAVQFLRQDINNCLEFQFENVANKVNYYPFRLNSNGADLMSTLSSRRTMSGTPWNVKGYLKSLLARYMRDKGTEGRVFDALAKKLFPEKILTVDLTSIVTFMDSTFAGIPEKEHRQFTAIIEAGALYKKFPDNEKIAREIMRYLAKKPSHDNVEGVLFFRSDDETSSDDTLYVWKKGAKSAERIGGSTLEALKAKNLSPDKYFSIYAERNTTGTDIPQLPDAICVMTFDEEMTTRTTAQAEMRFRQCLTSQNNYMAMTEEAKQYIFNGGRHVNDLITHGIVKQTVKGATHMERHFKQNIQNIFRMVAEWKQSEAIDHAELVNPHLDPQTRRSLHEALANEVERYEGTFLEPMNDQPYLDFGMLKEQAETKQSLIRSLEAQNVKFLKVLPTGDTETRMTVATLVEEMRTHISEADSLPKFRPEIPESLGMQVEIQQETLIEVEQQVQVLTEIENEVELELQQYRGLSAEKLNVERPMLLPEFENLLQTLKKGSLNAEDQNIVIPLQQQLQNFRYGTFMHRIPFHDAFQQPIFGTYTYFHACKNVLPVFHDMQRPAGQILAVRLDDRSIRWLLVSERQAHDIKKHLFALSEANNPLVANGVWIVQLDGSQLVKHANTELFPIIPNESNLDDIDILRDQVAAGLLEINAFAGNIDYLDRHPVSAEHWLKTNTSLRIHFLKLKALCDKDQKASFQRSLVIAQKDTTALRTANKGIQKDRTDAESARQGRHIPNSIVAAKTIANSRLIIDLNCEWVKHLGIDLQSNDPDTLAAIQQIRAQLNNPDNVNASSLEEEVAELMELQFSHLRAYHGPHITPTQVKWIPPSQTKILMNQSQFCTFNEDGAIVNYLLTREQILGTSERLGTQEEGITTKQAHLIPFVNPDYYHAFTAPWQIQAVPVEHLDKIDPSYYHHISEDQIHGIQDGHFMILLIQGNHLGEESYPFVHGNLCHLIPPEAQRNISVEQIAAINNPAIIRLLPEMENDANLDAGHFTKDIDPDMVPHIDRDVQLAHLSSAPHIQRVPNEWVPLLDNETQVPFISSTQVNSLTNEQLDSCPTPLIRFLNPERVEELFDDKLRYLRGEEQVRAIVTAERFAHLSGEETEGVANQMQWIAPAQYRWIQPGQVKGLNKNQLEAICDTLPDLWEAIKPLLERPQIRSFDTVKLVGLLSEEQIESHLGENQVVLLKKAEHIMSCPMELVHKLLPEQSEKINNPEKIQRFTKKAQIERVPTTLIHHLAVGQVQHLPNAKVQHVPLDKSAGLTSTQLLALSRTALWAEFSPLITQAQATGLNTQEYFNLLTPAQITAFATENQVRFMLSVEQIRACPPTLVRHLNPATQVPRILATQVPHLKGTAQHEALPAGDDYFENIAVKHYRCLPETLKGRLTPEKISRYDTAFPDKTVGVSLAYLRTNQEYATNPNSPVNLVKHMNGNQFSQFNGDDNDNALAGRFTSNQVRQLQPEPAHVNALRGIAPSMVQNLTHETMKAIPTDKKILLKNVPSNRLHQLKRSQIKARDLSWFLPKICYRVVGAVRTVFIPLTLVVQLVIDVVKGIFRTMCYAWSRSEGSKATLIRQWKKTFIWNPAITLIAPLQMWRPESYWKRRSRWTEYANGAPAPAA